MGTQIGDLRATHAVPGSRPGWEYGVANGGLNRRHKIESPPGVNRDKYLRSHSPLAREDLKLLGSEWSLTNVVCNIEIYALI